MKKLLFVAILGMSALVAHAQQWAGSSTTSDTIYRYGITQIRPTSNGNPYVQIKNNEIFVRKSYGTEYPENYVSITPTNIVGSKGVYAPTSVSNIGQGQFLFKNIASDGHTEIQFKLNSSGKLITDGDIQCAGLIATNKLAVNGANTSNTYKLAVNSGILCEELKVMADVPSSDFVFEANYNLKPLSEVEAFVTENKHLPDVPSAKEFKENGYKVGEMDNLLLQKIEELTLYIIDLQKQIEELKQEK